nr:50S ribosomal protein L25 [Paludibacteraceae bacterium]
MKEFDLKGALRNGFGKKASKLERSSEKVPCVLYGNGENVHFTVSEVDVLKLIVNPDVFVVNLDIEGKKCKA